MNTEGGIFEPREKIEAGIKKLGLKDRVALAKRFGTAKKRRLGLTSGSLPRSAGESPLPPKILLPQ